MKPKGCLNFILCLMVFIDGASPVFSLGWNCSRVSLFANPMQSIDKPVDASRLTTVGFPKLIFQLKIAGTKVVAKPITDRAQPIILRIVETYPHGTDFRYDIEYQGLEPGSYNLANYLRRDDGSQTTIPPIGVQVDPILAETDVLPTAIPLKDPQFASYYLPIMVVLGSVWLIGLLLILFYGRGKSKLPSQHKPQITVADKLYPLIESAMAGNLSTEQQAELERVLTAFWCKKLRLNHLSADALRSKLRQHEQASQMLKQIDAWLHRPPGDTAQPVDVHKLLEPYQTLLDQEAF